jgi:hypothetical protein
MTNDPPLNLRGISTLLQVSFWRVRGWRMRGHDGRERTYVLPEPDVSQLHRQPLWSTSAIVAWAEVNGLWPTGAITRTCPYGPCGLPCAPLAGENGVRPHRHRGDWCPGGGRGAEAVLAVSGG